MFECNHYCGTRALVNFPRTAVALVLLLNFLLTAMLNCAKQTSFLCVGRRASSSIEARKGGKISSSEILDCSKVQILSSQTHSSISARKGTFLKKKVPNNVAIVSSYSCLPHARAVQGSLFSTQELQLGLVWREGL